MQTKAPLRQTSIPARPVSENVSTASSVTLCDRTPSYGSVASIGKTSSMDAPEGPRRFSAVSPLMTACDDIVKTNAYGTSADPAEIESLLGRRSGDEDEIEIEIETSAMKEARLLFKYSVPLMFTYLLQYSFSLITIFVVGHIGTDELGAVSLATMTANITGFAIYEGLATSLDTLCAQAYGSGKKEQVGLHLQRMALLMMLVTVPIGAVWLCSGWLLAALVPEKELAYMAGSYLRILLACAPGFAIFEAAKRFTQAQGLFNASLYVLVVSTPLNIAFNYVFVFVLDWNLKGAAFATVLSNTLLPLFLWLYVYFVAPASLECWGGFTKSAFKNWGPMIKLALPGIVMVEAEWLAFDILTFSSSYISTAHLAAQSVVMTTSVAIYHIPFSVSIAVSTRLGNLVGAGALSAARIAARTYLVTFLVIGLVDATFLVATRHVLPNAFTDDPEVISIVSSVMPILALFQISDAGTALTNAILRGLGRQSIGGYVNLGVYYGVAIPVAFLLCFGKPKLGLEGLWMGCLLGSCLIWVVEGTYCRVWSWRKAIDEARGRIEQQ